MYPGLHAATSPDKPAVIMGGADRQVVTYRELEDRSIQLARVLHDRGLRRGDGVAILAENHIRYFEVYWAAIRSGLYLTAVNRYLSADEAAHLVKDSGSSALITTAQLAPTATSMLDQIPGCEVRLVMDGCADGFESYEEQLAAQPKEPLSDQPRGDVMLYSSGTTGRPKGIRRPLSDKQIDDLSVLGISSLEAMILGMTSATVYLCPAPLYHAAALQWSAGVHELGGTVVAMERFEPGTFLRLIEHEAVTHTQVVPTMLLRLLKLPEGERSAYDLSSLECILTSAAPCPPGVWEDTIAWLGPIMCEVYAGTEGVGLTFLDSAQWLAHPGSVGRPIVGIPHICDEAGKELPVGEIGVIYFEREEPAFEYHRDPEKTRASFHPERPTWGALGDIGYLDADGFLYLTDRRAFTIISGGVNIYPAEIESCLVMHPDVADVAVFGLPDPEMGEYVHAVVQLAAAGEATPGTVDELRAYVRGRMANYKVPRSIDFVDELPRLPTGKLAKASIRAPYLEGPT